MRRIRVLLLFILFPLASFAQLANQWVSHNQTYYKISVAETGIFRLTYDQLQQAGIPVNSIDPRLIQVFHRGEEQAIYFKHNQQPADANFENGEYLEFYGERNNGELDSRLYQPASAQPHKYYNLYSDTSAYFLTVNPLPVQGKRMEQFDQVNSAGIAKETFHTAEQLRVYTSDYSVGDTRDTYITQSFFDYGEGWTGSTICTQNIGCVEQMDFTIDQLTNRVTSQSPPTLEIQLTGRDFLQHKVEIYAGTSSSDLNLLSTEQFSNYQTPTYSMQVPWNYISADGKLVVRVKALGVNGNRDRLSVAYIKVNFAQGFNVSSATKRNFVLNENAGTGGKAYIELENTAPGTRLWDITDKSNVVQVGVHGSSALLNAIVPNTSSSRKLYASSVFSVPAVSQIKPVTFRELNPSSKFIIITHRSLQKPASGYSNPVRAFAEYRASEEGGGYDTLTVNIDQLYDQFNYGETSPLAIYEFMKYMVAQGDPQYLFIIGKGREAWHSAHRRILPANESPDLVPPAGNPGSDIPYSAGLKGNAYVAAVSTGRLTASTPQQVADYLNKVKESEATPFNDLWRKKLLHLSGGKEASQLILFRGYMEGFADIARGDYLGASVKNISKRGVSEVEFINVADEINAGVNLVTFYGHSAPNVTDIDIGFASDPQLGYNNAGKYPAFLVNGCNAGEYFNNGESFGENWTMTANKGARNFIANSSFGFELVLRAYSTYFYNVAFADSLFLTKGIGDVQNEVARRLLHDFGADNPVFTAQVQQMVLLGDPSLRLFAPTKPDFQTSDAMIDVVSFDGKPIHALSDSIQLNVIAKNLGRTTKRDLTMKVVHSINDAITEYNIGFKSVKNQDTLKLTIARGTGSFYGNNKIEVILDPENKIDELNEDNNAGEWTRFIQFNGTQNLQPGNFSIVNTTSLDALFQDTDVLSAEKTYDIQIDTSRSFNSSFFRSTTVTGKVLLKTHFELLDKDSTVYYWRTKPSGKPDDQWATTSFTYINNGPEGWTQMAFDQLLENSWDGLVADENRKRFGFESTSISFALNVVGTENTDVNAATSLTINNAEWYQSPNWPCRNNTINLVAFDRNKVIPYAAVDFDFSNSGGRACGREPQVINSFTATEVETGNGDDLFAFINNMKQSDSVLIFTVGDPGFASWSPALKSKLQEVGVSVADIDSFIPGEPIVILGRKSFGPGSAKIIRSTEANPKEQELQVTEELTGYSSSGSMESVVIGPALAWHQMSPAFKLIDDSDEAGIDIYLIDKERNESLFVSQQDEALDLEDIDASQFTYMRLIYRTKDEDHLTPAILKNWLVAYDPAPDGLLLPASAITPVSLPEGTTHRSDFAFVNISKIDFVDSLQSQFTVLNRTSRTKETQQFKIKGPAAGDTTYFSRTVNTLSKVGFNDLSTAVNTAFVPEQYLQNNSIELSSYLEVLKDQRNPVLEVTIDGRFVSDGDFVSANPVIRVTLRDDNTLLTLKDTTSLSLQMTDACATGNCSLKRIAFSRSDVSWSVEDGVLVVLFTPKDLDEGDYVLQANGTDVSGNPSGPEPYRVSFVVDKEPGMIFYPPYPNPSAVGFYFEFSAAGEESPESFVLAIVNRSGQDIAKFTEQDSPSLHVGRNQFRWTGLDAQGNRLSDGLYFYQLTVRTGGNEYRNSGRLMIIR